MVLGLQNEAVWITVSFFCFFLLLPIINSGAEVLIRSRVPNETQGRAWGLIGLISQIGYLLAYLSAGFLADALFTPLLLPGLGLACTALLAGYLFNRPALHQEREGVVHS